MGVLWNILTDKYVILAVNIIVHLKETLNELFEKVDSVKDQLLNFFGFNQYVGKHFTIKQFNS